MRVPSALLLLASPLAALLTGCGAGTSFRAVDSPRTPVSLAGVHGTVFGGRQPISGARIQLYQAGTAGYGAGATGLISNGGVLTNATGGFNITGTYTCAAGSQVYLMSTGGDPGGGINPSAVLLAGLGLCDNLSASTFISMNENTTVATVWALQAFLTPASGAPAINQTGAVTTAGINIGAPVSNTLGLQQAFADINTVVNTATGYAPGALPAGATLSRAEVHTLANVLAACVNSTGLGTNGSCDRLQSYTIVTGLTPYDTVAMGLSMARNPGHNVTSITAMSVPNAPYQPTVASLADFTIGVTYTGNGLNAPASLAVDAGGNIWAANAAGNTVAKLAHNGAPLSGTAGFSAGGTLNTPVALAVDASGNVWVANKGNSTLSAVNNNGDNVTGSPFTGGGLNAPSSLAFDALGSLWVTNSGSNTLSTFTSAGAPITGPNGSAASGIAAPVGVAINPH